MAIDYIITSAFNLFLDQVQSLSTTRNHGTLTIYLLLLNKRPIFIDNRKDILHRLQPKVFSLNI